MGMHRLAACVAAVALLGGCGKDNSYKPPPPAAVTVAPPVARKLTRYLEVSGSVAAYNIVDLVARVQGFLTQINYQDGAMVKKGAVLFTIEPEPYKLKLDQAQAAEQASQSTLTQAEAEYKRQAALGTKQFASQSVVDQNLAARDTARANLLQAQANTKLAQINYGYTQVMAPFDGLVTAHLVSVGELVGTSPTQLATIAQFDPIYVNFNISEQDVERIRASMAQRGVTAYDLRSVPVDVGLQSENGYPHTGVFDYAAPIINQATGTLAVRAVFKNTDRALLPGNFVRVRLPVGEDAQALLVPDTAIGSDQGGRYVLVVNADNVVEQRKITIGPLEGALRVADSGLKPDDRVVVGGIMRAVPGQKVAPQIAAAAVSPATKTP
jgi:RND family efflux transporter MFP subunit